MSSFLIAAAMTMATAVGAPATVNLNLVTVDGIGASVGKVTVTDTPNGAVFQYQLMGLPPGPHGFHVHDKGSCGPGPNKDGKIVAAGAAGGHLDPAASGQHLGPDGAGHMGDLPRITVDASGMAAGSVLAPHLKSAVALKGHALMLHAGGDNYRDDPAPLGGGGARLACGVAQ